MSKVFIGTLAPHITTEVDCESFFNAEMFERLVMGKHWISRIYCCPVKVLNEFMERWKNKSWRAEEDRDDVKFWEKQKEEFLQDNPT